MALDIRDQENDIWIWDLTRRTPTRLTFDPAPDSHPVWSHDSHRVILASMHSGQTSNLYWQAADGTGAPERLTESRNTQFPQSITPNGTEIVFRHSQEDACTDAVQGGQWDLMGLLLDSKERPPSSGGSKTSTPLVKTNSMNSTVKYRRTADGWSTSPTSPAAMKSTRETSQTSRRSTASNDQALRRRW